MLGRGGNKSVYACGDNQAVGVLRNGTNSQAISDEIEMLGKLHDAGVPTVNPQAVSVDGTPGMQFAQGSKDVVRLVDGKVRIVGDSPLLNQQSISDLQGIRDTIVNKNIQINDLQFLISNEGQVVVADPLAINFNAAPSRKQSSDDRLVDSGSTEEWAVLMGAKYMTSMVPSVALEFLRRLTGKRVAKLVRYSWWPASEVAAQCGIEDKLAFSLTAGPLAVYFEDGVILGFSSDPSLNSIIVWDEAARGAGQGPTSLDSDEELFAISESGRFSTAFWKQLIGCCVSDLIILKRGKMNAKERQRPSEVGLRFSFSEGKSFVVSHGLHDNSDDFSVLEESQLNAVELEEIPID